MPRFFRKFLRTQDEWVAEYQRRGAYFQHDGNPKRPHFLLTSGQHSVGFFNSRILIADERLMREVACDIVTNIIAGGLDITLVDRVVGPKTGATKLSEFVAAEIGACRGFPCGWASPKKVQNAEGKTVGMEFDDPDHAVLSGEAVLFVEDVMTTGGSVLHAVNAAVARGGSPLGFIGMMVNRSGETSINGMKMVALVARHLPNFDVPGGKPCPLCAEGSVALPAKDNWAAITADY